MLNFPILKELGNPNSMYMQTGAWWWKTFSVNCSRAPMRVLLIGDRVSTLCSNCRREDHPQSATMPVGIKEPRGNPWLQVWNKRSTLHAGFWVWSKIKLNNARKNKTSRRKMQKSSLKFRIRNERYAQRGLKLKIYYFTR